MQILLQREVAFSRPFKQPEMKPKMLCLMPRENGFNE
jgi:hypothetical protein